MEAHLGGNLRGLHHTGSLGLCGRLVAEGRGFCQANAQSQWKDWQSTPVATKSRLGRVSTVNRFGDVSTIVRVVTAATKEALQVALLTTRQLAAHQNMRGSGAETVAMSRRPVIRVLQCIYGGAKPLRGSVVGSIIGGGTPKRRVVFYASRHRVVPAHCAPRWRRSVGTP
jgi:hypothetical protein